MPLDYKRKFNDVREYYSTYQPNDRFIPKGILDSGEIGDHIKKEREKEKRDLHFDIIHITAPMKDW